MDAQEVVKLIDHLVFTKTGKHLDDLQEAILSGSLRSQTYATISSSYPCTEGHARDVGYELWQLLSSVLGDDVNKSNLKSVLDRWEFSGQQQFGDRNIGNQFNICNSSNIPENFISESLTQKNLNKKIKHRTDLADAPIQQNFYGRVKELNTLQNWIVNEKSRLVILTGLPGIGKSAITQQLVSEIQGQFDFILWHSLCYTPTLKQLRSHIMSSMTGEKYQQDDSLAKLLDYFRQNKCLIILDDLQNIFQNQELAGHYLNDYQDYSQFFQTFSQVSHQSCLILMSWEKPPDIASLSNQNNSYACCLPIKGIDLETSQQILSEYNLRSPDLWEKLTNNYHGNPGWLKIIASTIQDLFAGDVAKFLADNQLFLDLDLEILLNKSLNRLSNIEKSVISQLVSVGKQQNIADLIKNVPIPNNQILNAIKSLQRRAMIETTDSTCTLLPLLREHIKLSNYSS
jgi:hypothetical protein